MISTLKKINFLITKRQRKGLVKLTFLLFIGMILEIFGIGILIPTISILLDPEMIQESIYLSSIREKFSKFSDQSFIFLFLGFIVLIYFIKSIFIVFLTLKQNRFLSNLTAYVSNNLFSSYLTQPYSFHLNRNASDLIKNIQIEINYLHTFLVSLITLFIEGGFLIAILATLIYIEPLGAICIGLFYGLLSIIFLQFTKRKLNLWGDLRQELDSQVSRIALEGLGGVKDLLILGKINFYIKNYSEKNYLKGRIGANQGTISQIPRIYLEFISIVGLISFIITLLLQGKDSVGLITVLGVFVAATFRMIPSLNKIIAAVQSMKYYLPSVNVVYKEIHGHFQINQDEVEFTKVNFNNEIEFKKVNFSFKQNYPVLIDIDLKINQGEIVGIIGESGSGKSTLVDLLVGLHKQTSGEILVDGELDFQLTKSWRNNIGYVSQSIFLTDDTIKNNIALGVNEDEIDEKKIHKLIKDVQLQSFIENLEFGINSMVGERGIQLSGGQRQRIGIARALYNQPEILVFDEATSALDNKTEKEVMKSIFNLKSGKTIILVAHRLSTLSDADVVYEIKNNQIIKK